MPVNRRRHRHRLPLAIASGIGLLVAGLWWGNRFWNQAPQQSDAGGPHPGAASPSEVPPFRWTDLTPEPRWQELDVYQGSMTRPQFEHLLTQVFTIGNGWESHLELGSRVAAIETEPGTRYLLRFADEGESKPPQRYWRSAAELGLAPEGKPMAGLHVVIDPGHLGGPWARMEERWFRVGDAPPVTEGDLTLLVANLLRPRLEALGAKVSLVRSNHEPVTPVRPESIEQASASDNPPSAALQSAQSPRQTAELLFYRTAEIRARARLVNETLRPDLVLCLHFNAEEWGDPARPTLVASNHLHLLLSGAATGDEIAAADQRHELLVKLLQGTHAEETSISKSVAEVFARESGLPPYRYEPDSPRARNIAGDPYLWARNLLANRAYRCPVVFLEPYVMNCPEVHERIQAGDYSGTRTVAGRERPSIFREYANALAKGLARHYLIARRQATE